MMTLHSAKGWSFGGWSCGMETACSVSASTLGWPTCGLEEEAAPRICRRESCAASFVHTYAEQRRLYGVDTYGSRPAYRRGWPPELVEEIRRDLQVYRPIFVKRSSSLE